MNIILALDDISFDEGVVLAREIKDKEEKLGKSLIWGLKLNSMLLEVGVAGIELFKRLGFCVMADPKLYDIPNTIQNSLKILRSRGADIVTVHCSANFKSETDQDIIAGVTVLTSFTDQSFRDVYGTDVPPGIIYLSGVAIHNKYAYLVCSPKDIQFIKDHYRELKEELPKIICPGIRPEWYQKQDDQKRSMTPQGAILAGASLIVIGRPILSAKDPIEALIQTNRELGNI